MMIGQIAVMKITNRAEGSASRNTAREIGSQARGGTVRSTWKIGSRPRWAQVLDPIRTPRAMPTTAQSEKPTNTRLRLVATCQNRPLSTPPWSKKGWMIRSLESRQISRGDGKLAAAPEVKTCQSARSTSRVMTGGSTALASPFSPAMTMVAAAARRRGKATTGDGALVTGGVGLNFKAGWLMADLRRAS